MVEWHTRQWGELPCVGVTLPGGDCAWVSLYGAQVLSWVSQGRERMFLSPRAHLDGRHPVRGGVPVCWPQFNQRGLHDKHGFARQKHWRVHAQRSAGAHAEIELSLRQDTQTLRRWPQAFDLNLCLQISPGQLHLQLSVHNPSPTRMVFSGALHTYLAVDDVRQAQLLGLQGQAEWNAVTDVHGVASAQPVFDAAFDRVYTAPPHPLTLVDGAHRLRLAQSSWSQTVVWTPGPTLSAQLDDMAEDSWTRMLCVEAAQVDTPLFLDPAHTWVGTQTLTVEN